MRRPVLLIAILAGTAFTAGPVSAATPVASGPVAVRAAVQAKAAKATKAKAKARKTKAKKTTAKKRCTTRTVRSASGRRRTVKTCRKLTPAKAKPQKTTTPTTPAAAPSSSRSPATTPVGASTPAPTGLAGGVRDCANSERAKAGLPPLADDPALDRAAVNHATDMRDRQYFAHESPEGTLPWDRIEKVLFGEEPFVWMGENIAMGFADVASTCVGWMNSPGHRANILNPHYDTIGTAWVDSYAVQEFGGRSY